MPDITSEDRNGHIRTLVTLKPGESIHLCRCHQSKSYPLCDGAHKRMENNIGPAVVEAQKPEA